MMKRLLALLLLTAGRTSLGFTWTSSPHSRKPSSHAIVRSRTSAPPLSMVRIEHAKDDYNTKFQRFLLRLGRGIMFAKPVGPTCSQALFGLSIRSRRKNDKDNKQVTSLSFTLKECLVAVAVYLGVGVTFYSIIMENWSIIDSIYFSIVVFTT